MNPKKNSCRGNYMRKYGKLPVKSFNLKKTRFHKKKPGDYKGIQITTTFLPILLFRTKYYSKYANIKSTLQDLTYHFDVMPIAYFLWQVEHWYSLTVVVTLRTKAMSFVHVSCWPVPNVIKWYDCISLKVSGSEKEDKIITKLKLKLIRNSTKYVIHY